METCEYCGINFDGELNKITCPGCGYSLPESVSEINEPPVLAAVGTWENIHESFDVLNDNDLVIEMDLRGIIQDTDINRDAMLTMLTDFVYDGNVKEPDQAPVLENDPVKTESLIKTYDDMSYEELKAEVNALEVQPANLKKTTIIEFLKDHANI